ncbi:MAG: GxGYxYP family putative glycoside hydrolase [Bacteroidota bacterium]|nr:GxGYxYP family putative glycoside hydrolase [Bacteroidota bacterium]
MEGSPYPASQRPDTLYRVTDANFSNSQLLTVGTLQGLLAQKKPKIYRSANPTYNIWLDDLKQNYGVTVIYTYDSDFNGLIKNFKNEIGHYILCNLNDNSVNVAISLCGISNSVAITTEQQSFFNSLGIPMYADVRGKDESWFFDNYGTQMNKKAFCFQTESAPKFLSDYSVFGKMITFYNTSFDANTDKIFAYFDPDAALFGWGFDEGQLVAHTSQYNIFVHAADYANNLSTLSNFNYTEAKQKQSIREFNQNEQKHTVCFLMTDGDNLQWMLSSFAGNANWYGSGDRGTTYIGWTMSPAMAELAPTALKKIYDLEKVTSTGRDYFVAAPSGLGYMNPDMFKDVTHFAKMTNDYMAKADLNILNIIGNNDNDIYLTPFMQQPYIDAVFYYYYSNYAGGGGKIKWTNGKPVIHGRYNLWRDVFENSTTLASKLNTLSTNIYSTSAYSLIPVHVWTESVTDVINCTKLLNSNVRVVTPDEFVSLIKKNLGPREDIINFTPGNTKQSESQFLVSGFTGTGSDSLHRWADGNAKIIYHFNKDVLFSLSKYSDLRLAFTVGNEYKVSVTNSLDAPAKEVFRWSTDTTKHMHTLANKKELYLSLEEYLDQAWEDIYVIFEDGMKSDGYGASLYNISIREPKETTAVEKIEKKIPNEFHLEQNFPNPFNPVTMIRYNLNESSNVKLDVFDLLGRHVRSLVNAELQKGNYSVRWDGLDDMGQKVQSGIYFYRLSAGQMTETRKMVLLK